MGATRSAERQVVLRDGVIYVAFDRFVCSSVTCAGSTAVATGRDIDGHKLREVDAADLAEWAGYGLGAMRCECGRVVGDHPERS